MLQRNYQPMFIDCTCLRLSWWKGVVPLRPYLNVPHTHFLTQAEIHRNTNMAQRSNKFDTTSWRLSGRSLESYKLQQSWILGGGGGGQ